MTSGKETPAWPGQFSLPVLLPIVLSLLCAAVGVFGFVLWSVHATDERSLARQANLARHVIANELQRIPRDQESVTIWDDAVTNTRLQFDDEWIDANLGAWMYDYFGHDDVLVLDDHDRPIYAMSDGGRVDAGKFDRQVLADIAPALAALRAKIAAGGIEAYSNGEVATPPRINQLTTLRGAPSILSLAPIISDTGNIAQATGSEYVHVSIVRLDRDLAARIGEQYQIDDVAFVATPSDPAGMGVIALTDPAGRFATFMQWTPQLTGRDILNQTMPVVVAAFLAVAVTTIWLSFQLWRKSRALEAGRVEAEHRAAHDPLTRLPNRISFESQLIRVLAQRPTKDRRASVLILDLDRFKQVNDTLGHRAGDELVRAVGQRLGQLLAPTDILARLGGDEFGIVHIHAPGLTAALELSEKIIEAINKPFDIFASEAFVGVSIGIATAEGGEVDPHELVRKADIALHEAKATGRNRAVVFEEAMNEFLQNRKTIEAELREALRRDDQLAVAFQPLFDANGTIIGAEALARWTHPRLGQISPAHFVPVAEATALIIPLGAFVLREACRMGARWPGYTIAVNISPVQLRDPAFPGTVFQLLNETGMHAEDLELEITEGILLEEASIAADALRIFRAAGIRIALDDFGTGYSSLNYLKRYPVDRIKIDRSFVSQLAPGSVSVPIVDAMVNLAHALKIEVTAEGVETSQQMDVLSQLGCNVFQGFLLSAPVSPAALDKLLSPPQVQVA